ncbi:AP endonuclease [Erysipelothrix larvae]|uniref:AP endonuclease n=1 Tax=Erysipelothrix larvae TaxID=1514105 RepID=A0A109UHA3_9FIRM|nr:sugar phosphate isomerase/epimerase [Erysipelothrix larvae]AMC93977.1 AP endonuclease [Erysipelothrix larvae]
MKFGLNTAILGHMDFDQVLEFCHGVGYKSLEVACWPSGKKERRYAGVSHINVDALTPHKVEEILHACETHDIEISALAYYPNPLDENLEARAFNIEHLKKVIEGANKLNVGMVTTFIGRMQTKTLEENLLEFKAVWPDIIHYAKQLNVKIAIENCPMLFSNDEWPGGQNIFTSPAIWCKCFELIPEDNFGINFDPSHFIWQQMDYIKPITEFKDRIFHIHFKDIKLYRDQLDDYGCMATPLHYMAPKIPGLGDVDWAKYISALRDINYKGHACVEVEDRSFEDTTQDIEDSCILSYRYLSQFLI